MHQIWKFDHISLDAAKPLRMAHTSITRRWCSHSVDVGVCIYIIFFSLISLVIPAHEQHRGHSAFVLCQFDFDLICIHYIRRVNENDQTTHPQRLKKWYCEYSISGYASSFQYKMNTSIACVVLSCVFSPFSLSLFLFPLILILIISFVAIFLCCTTTNSIS